MTQKNFRTKSDLRFVEKLDQEFEAKPLIVPAFCVIVIALILLSSFLYHH